MTTEKEPIKIDKKITGYKVITQEEAKGVQEAEQSHFIKAMDLPKVVLPLKRPRKLTSETYRLKPPHYEHAIYVHISDIIYEDRKYPFEIFFSCKNPENIMWVSTITLLLSEAFREAITGTSKLANIVKNLKDVCDASGGYFATVGEKKKHVGSIVAEIGYLLEKHIEECNIWNYENYEFQGETAKGAYEALRELDKEAFESSQESPTTEEEKETTKAWSSEFMKSAKFINRDYFKEETSSYPTTATICTKCGEKAVILMDGCMICLACADSKCG